MNLACCLWALTGPETDLLARVAGLGFEWIDLQPTMLVRPESRRQARELGLKVSCLGASFGMPDDSGLDRAEEAARARALDHLSRSMAHAAELGAGAAYVIPGLDDGAPALARLAASLRQAAEVAAGFGLKLCLEHFPGRALPTAAGTLAFIEEVDHPNLYLLFDLGHVQLSGEDPAAVIAAAGPRLGYVHLDDNDGEGDLHWSLLDGVVTAATLRRTLAALAAVGYSGAISLELSPGLPDPADALRRSRELVLEALKGSA